MSAPKHFCWRFLGCLRSLSFWRSDDRSWALVISSSSSKLKLSSSGGWISWSTDGLQARSPFSSRVVFSAMLLVFSSKTAVSILSVNLVSSYYVWVLGNGSEDCSHSVKFKFCWRFYTQAGTWVLIEIIKSALFYETFEIRTPGSYN